MTHEGPTEANRKAVEFTYILKAKGWSANTSVNGAPNKEMVFKISGKNPCYGVTSNCLLTCAKVILREHQKMPGK